MSLRRFDLWLACIALAACSQSSLSSTAPESLEVVVERMCVDDRLTRRQAGDALRQFGAKAVPPLVRQLGALDSAAAQASGRIVGKPVTTPAVMLRGYAASALGEIGPPALDALDELDAASKSFTPDVSEQYRDFVALRARAAAMKIRDSIPAEFVAELGDRRAPGWTGALEVAAELGSRGAELAPLVCEALDDPGCPRRDLAARALGRIGSSDERVLSALARASSDADATVRLFAVRALGQLGPPARATRSAVEARLADPQPAVRERAIVVLVELSTAADAARNTELLQPLLRDPFEEVRARAERALAQPYGVRQSN